MVIEHKGYRVSQAENNHVVILKDGHRVFHSQANEPKTEQELRETVDFYLALCAGSLDEVKRK